MPLSFIMLQLDRKDLEMVGVALPPSEERGEPEGLSPEVMELRATTFFELAMTGEIEPGKALKKLVHYGAYHFNTLRQNYPGLAPHFAGSNLAGMALTGFNFEGASFAGANIAGACFVGCDLRGVKWDGAIGRAAFIADCTLDGGEAEVSGVEDLTNMAGYRHTLDASLGWDVK